MRRILGLAAVLMATSPALGQDVVVIERGPKPDRPFTLIYPDTMTLGIRGGALAASLKGGIGEPWQCKVFVPDDGPESWDAGAALAAFDRDATAAYWAENYPGIHITTVDMAAFQSGPAIRWEAESESSSSGAPVHLVSFEAQGGGFRHQVLCTVELDRKSDAIEIFDFIGRNFSTSSDAQCCVPKP